MNTETITAAIQIAKALETEPAPHPLPENGDLLPAALVGADVLIRTVTMIYTGILVAVDAHTIVLDNAAWIADTGRFSTALATGELSEVEPYPDTVYITRSCVVDITFWNHALPRNAK
jgi:hypothetical protein